MVELFLASIALFIWLHTEPGRAHLLAYNTILIAGASTVLFNANPLLRFDGYYMLMDFLEIPNLKQRANRYFEYLSERYVLAQHEAQLPIATAGERTWFVLYGVASAAYRVVVVVGILLFLGDRFPLAALLFAALTAVTMIIRPIGKGVIFLFSNPRLRLVRLRAVTTVALLMMLVVGVVGFVPMPVHTMAEGVVWLPEDAFVRAGVDGFIERVLAPPGARVQVGEILVICRNPELSTRLRVLNAQLQELEARRREQAPTDRVKMEMLEEEIRYTTTARDEARTRVTQLAIRSQRTGVFVAPTVQDLARPVPPPRRSRRACRGCRYVDGPSHRRSMGHRSRAASFARRAGSAGRTGRGHHFRPASTRCAGCRQRIAKRRIGSGGRRTIADGSERCERPHRHAAGLSRRFGDGG
jgi:Membrane-fusion protein